MKLFSNPGSVLAVAANSADELRFFLQVFVQWLLQNSADEVRFFSWMFLSIFLKIQRSSGSAFMLTMSLNRLQKNDDLNFNVLS